MSQNISIKNLFSLMILAELALLADSVFKLRCPWVVCLCVWYYNDNKSLIGFHDSLWFLLWFSQCQMFCIKSSYINAFSLSLHTYLLSFIYTRFTLYTAVQCTVHRGSGNIIRPSAFENTNLANAFENTIKIKHLKL